VAGASIIATCSCRCRVSRKPCDKSPRSSSRSSASRGRLSGTPLRALHSPDEIEAARRLAPWLERADREGVGRRLARAIDAAIADGSLVPTPRRAAHHDAQTHVPAALQIYAVEAPDLSRYDALLERASA
jgi:hypothetical protein